MLAGLTSRCTMRWRVGAGQRPAELRGDAAGLPGRQRPAAQAGGQALAVDQLRDVVQALGGVADVVDLDDAGVAHPGQQPRLALEGGHPLGIIGPPRLDDLDRHGPRQAPVKALVDAAERALADDRAELVAVVQGAAGQVGGVGHRRSVRG